MCKPPLIAAVSQLLLHTLCAQNLGMALPHAARAESAQLARLFRESHSILNCNCTP